ncbi:putative pigment production hydroxylase [Caenibius tardaugens NBRC 16725]|uniref:Putative pigment production hydroxylase n=1 Tax=Caenibius tardaugens NBRC 16725 TaxID=1219035 RepID=U2ZYK6_9SPHN|nr:acyl-CoA dehydrogenase family protein [Caenibius tardaugens]GAD50464.1 putative pigment production hydroxylase [Caenibius tardaugens NBRC 16725]
MSEIQRRIVIADSDQANIDRLVQSARDMAPRIAARAAAGEAARRISDDTIREAGEAGFYKILTPKSLGGFELDWETACRVVVALGRGDASSAWQIGFFIIHNWLWLCFPEETRREIQADRGWAIGPVMLSPATVRGTKVDGGYRLRGRSKWATGINHAHWILIDGIAEGAGEDGSDCLCDFLVEPGQVIVHDTWNSSGMRATGSHDLEYPDIFIPERRVVPYTQSAKGGGAGYADFDGWQYQVPRFASATFGAASPIVAAAYGAIDAYRDKLLSYVSPIHGTNTINNPLAVTRLARAETRLQAAEQYLYALARQLKEWQTAGQLTLLQRVNIRSGAAHCVAEARDVVQDLASAAGSSSFMADHPLQRVLRDVTMMANHFLFEPDTSFEPFGRVMLGLEPNTMVA